MGSFNISNNINFNSKLDYYIISSYNCYERNSSQKIIRKYWYNYKLRNYVRNISRSCIFRDELIYLPKVGIKYFEGLERWNSRK